MKYAEKFKRSPNNYSIKKLNICGIPLSVAGKKTAFYQVFRCFQSSGLNTIYIYCRRTNQEPGKDAKGRNAG